MKKLYTLTAAALLSLGGYVANAQDMYLIGPFNNYGQDSDMSAWKLEKGEVEDENTANGQEASDESNEFSKLFENIPTGQFEICFKYGDYYLVPSVNGEASPSNVVIPESGTSNSPYVESATPVYWECITYSQHDVQFLVNTTDKTVLIAIDSDLEDVWYIRGAFNNYKPEGKPQYALLPITEDEEGNPENGLYQGTFKIPANQFSVNFMNGQGLVFLPETISETEIEFDDNNRYKIGYMEYWDQEGDENIYWVDKDWEGGWIKVTIDSNNGSCIIVDVSAEMEAAPDPVPPTETPEFIYISGNFNNYQPGNNAEYGLILSSDEDNEGQVVYTGLIEIPQNGFYFNFTYGDQAYLNPANDVNEDVSFSDNEYASKVKVGNGQSYWSLAQFEGGEVYFEVNVTIGTIVMQYEGEIIDVWYISGAFNNYNPGASSAFALNPVGGEDENAVYSGTFTVPANKFSFNLISPQGQIFVPLDVELYEGTNEVVTFEEGEFTGNMIDAYDETEEKMYWSYPEWEGGKITVTIVADEGSIIIADATTGINSINKVDASDVVYNLQGVKVSNSNLRPGLYIINGKKVIVK